jgi:hypothetical protein
LFWKNSPRRRENGGQRNTKHQQSTIETCFFVYTLKLFLRVWML